MSTTTKVFISYTHDTPTHKQSVLALAQRLRDDGIDCQIDQYVNGSPSEGWPLWMERQIESAAYVLVVCTAAYLRRYEGREEPRKGLGATWEAILTRQKLFENGPNNEKFVPVLFEGTSASDIPKPLQPHTFYKMPDAYDDLLRYLTKQPAVIPKPIGRPKMLPPIQEAPTGGSAVNLTTAPTDRAGAPPWTGLGVLGTSGPPVPKKAPQQPAPSPSRVPSGFAYPPFPQPQHKALDLYVGMSEDEIRERNFERAARQSFFYFEEALARSMPGSTGFVEVPTTKIPALLTNLAECRGEGMLWWTWNRSDLAVDRIERFRNVWLINKYEVALNGAWILRAEPYWSAVVLRSEAMPSMGLRNDLARARKGEEYPKDYGAWFQGRYITTDEYHDGYAEIDGNVVNLENADLRIRVLREWYFFLHPKMNALGPWSPRADDLRVELGQRWQQRPPTREDFDRVRALPKSKF